LPIRVERLPLPAGASLDELLHTMAGQRFDLASGALLRVWLLPGEQSPAVLLVAHRMVLDWRGASRLAAEIFDHYATGSPAPQTLLPADRLNFAVWQRAWAKADDFRAQREWWKDKLGTQLPVLQLPAVGRRTAGRTFAGGEVRTELPADTAGLLRTHPCANTQVGLESLLLAAYAALLLRYSGQSDLVVGWNVSADGLLPGRVELGPTENWLALRLSVDASIAFSQLLSEVSQETAQAWEHRGVPFDVLLRDLSLPARSVLPPLIQAQFEFREELRTDAIANGGAFARVSEVVPAATPFELHLVVTRNADAVELSLRFNTELFNLVRAQRFLGHFTGLLASALQNPSCPVGRLSLMNGEEIRQIVTEFNATAAPYPHDRCLHQLVENQATRFPDNTAYVFEGRNFRYGQVNGWANAIAGRLAARGIGRGHFVPLLMDRSVELPVCMLAVMKAGAAYVPMDVHWPAQRIHHIVRDTNCPVVLVTESPAAQLPAEVEVWTIDTRDLGEDVSPPSVAITSDDPIYMIYTSGSTGVPKGAINKHRGIVNRLSYMTRRYGCAVDDVILQTSAHIFDASVWQYFWPLINGAKCILPSPMAGFDHRHITELIGRYQVTVTDFVPSVFNILVDILDKDTELRNNLKSLRQILIGGEALSPKAIFRFLESFPRVGITNTYGPTETSIGVIFYEVGKEYEDPLPIGRPIANVNAYVLDELLQPVPIGVPGMLYVGGDCVGLGYHGDPVKTAAAFLDNPFREVHPGPIYRTGDLARYRESGDIEFLGRADHQVKIRGVRIELGEIEAKLAQHPGISAAVVNLWEATGGAKRLAAYIVSTGAEAPTTEELRAFLKESLPEYVIPHAFVRLSELPLLRSGKVDRKSLPPPTDEPDRTRRRGPPPQTRVQSVIAQTWRDEIGIPYVSIHDNFFELGGDSLGAVRVVARLELQFGIRLEAEQMMIQSLGQLAASVPGETESMHQDAAPDTRSSPVLQPFYFGELQRQLFGALHDSTTVARSGVVVCSPLGHEYIFCHRSLRHLAQLLAERATPVLRFDYFGTGDSQGEARAMTLSGCVDDTKAAVAEISGRLALPYVSLVGLRLGGAIASLLAARLSMVAKIVLWDPVFDGESYLRDLQAVHSSLVGGRSVRKSADRGKGSDFIELAGFPMSMDFHAEIKSIGPQAYASLGGKEILLVDSSEGSLQEPLAASLSATGVKVDYVRIPYPEIWNQDPYKTRLPTRIIDEVCRWLSGETS